MLCFRPRRKAQPKLCFHHIHLGNWPLWQEQPRRQTDAEKYHCREGPYTKDRSRHLKSPERVPDTQHTFFEELQQSSSWVNKNSRQPRSLRMEECTPKLSSDTQTQEVSDNPWPTVMEGGDDHLLYSLPHTPHELCISL